MATDRSNRSASWRPTFPHHSLRLLAHPKATSSGQPARQSRLVCNSSTGLLAAAGQPACQAPVANGQTSGSCCCFLFLAEGKYPNEISILRLGGQMGTPNAAPATSRSRRPAATEQPPSHLMRLQWPDQTWLHFDEQTGAKKGANPAKSSTECTGSGRPSRHLVAPDELKLSSGRMEVARRG